MSENSQSIESIEERIKKIIIQNLAPEENKITPDASFTKDLGADSLDTVELIMALEEEFKIEIPDNKAEEITTVKGAIDYIKEQLNSSKS